MKFEKNEVVKILPRKWIWRGTHPFYIDEMIQFEGEIVKVNYYIEDDIVSLISLYDMTDTIESEIEEFSWHVDWLESTGIVEGWELKDEDFEI